MSLSWISQLPLAEQEFALNEPSLQPPPGIVPNLENPPNRNYLGYVTNALCITALSAVVIIRSYAKIFCIRKIELEDYVTGVFVHQWDIRIKDMINLMHMLHIYSNLAAVTIGLIKSAILIEWIRIFVPRGTQNYFFWTARTILLFHVLFHISWILVENLSCTPYQKIWDQTIAEGHCINQKIIFIPAATVNLVTNFVVLLLPQKVIWELQLSLRNKIGVSIVFAIGIFACIAATFRLAESVEFYRSDDLVYSLAAMDHWILVEMTCQFVVFCAPTTPIVFKGLGISAKVATATRSWVNVSSKPSHYNSRTVSFPRASRAMNKVFHSRQMDKTMNYDNVWSMSFISNTGNGPTTEITVQPPLSVARPPGGILCTTQFTAEITHEGDYQDRRMADTLLCQSIHSIKS
ncbi:hypothetical protein F5X99DRAFT_416174 [Biscogniauxia marginata]|nr:hypothetical protein F5X99DRAFT_416174 [Biscogniauxia marginata]